MAAQIMSCVNAGKKGGMIPAIKAPNASFLRGLAPEDEVLLNRLISERSDFVEHSDFEHSPLERQLFGAVARLVNRKATRFIETQDAITHAVKARERPPALTYAQEGHLFMRYNYARRRVALLLEAGRRRRLSSTQVRHLLAWGHRALIARSVIVRLNMPLVLAMAKRTKLSNIDFNELISEGNMALLRSVEKFDCSRGFKFSTYSCRAILKSFSRVAMRASRYRGTFPTEFDPAMERSDFVDRQRKCREEDCVDEVKEIFLRNLACLSAVEQTVISERFAMGAPTEGFMPQPKTLEQVGHIIGVTKERVRQIQNNALKKIRVTLEDRFLAA